MIFDGGVSLSEPVDLIESIPFEVVGLEVVLEVFHKAGPSSEGDGTIVLVDILEKHCFPGVSVSSFYVSEGEHHLVFVVLYFV